MTIYMIKMKKIISFFLVISAVFCTADIAVSKEKKNAEEAEPFDRGIGRTSSCFIPKGTVGAGVSFSYNSYSLGNGSEDSGYAMLFSLIQDLHGNMMSFGISPFASYFIADNLSVGARFDYSRSTLGLDNVNLSLMEDMNLSLQGFRYFKQSYTGSLTLRNYIPFGMSKRFAMFTEVRATGGYGQGKTYKVIDNQNVGTYQDIYNFELGFVPGIAAFITNEVAFEVSVGLLGFEYQKIVQLTNQVERSEMEHSGANFKVNLLSIGFGLSFYIPTGNKAKSTKSDKQ